jgi:hypothetical protein
MLTRYSNVELANFAEREVHMRRRVYRRLVARFQPIPDLHRRASSGNDIEGPSAPPPKPATTSGPRWWREDGPQGARSVDLPPRPGTGRNDARVDRVRPTSLFRP